MLELVQVSQIASELTRLSLTMSELARVPQTVSELAKLSSYLHVRVAMGISDGV